VTASLGVAVSQHPPCVDAKMLLQLADDALYRAKENGRNRCELAAGQELIGSALVLGRNSIG